MGRVVALDFDTAVEHGVNTALVLNELSFWSTKKSSRKDGWIYKTYEEMTDRLPLSERTIRRAYTKLHEAGLITTRVMKLNGTPVLHYKLAESEPAKLTGTKETANLAESINTVNNHKTNKDADSKNTDESSDVSFGEQVNEPAPHGATTETQRLLEYVISVVNPREKVTKTRLTLVNARLKDYTAREIALSAQVFSQSTWHKENKQMSVDNLLAPTKFGRWYSQIDEATILSDKPIETPEQRRERERLERKARQEEQMKRNKELMDEGI